MEFRTKVELPKRGEKIWHEDRILVMGSCFSEHIGRKLQDNKFRCVVNPFGELYNPYSITHAIERIVKGTPFTPEELVKGDDGLWHSMMHHGSFSAATPDECLQRINVRLAEAHDFLSQADWVMITLGSSIVYEDKTTKKVVGNCHHFPAKQFKRRIAMSLETALSMSKIMGELRKVNSDIKLLLTVSPVRHQAEGLHANQVSKAGLLCGIDMAQQMDSNIYYFPAYEIMMDELRDYRFYADDMMHPSAQAVDYIWECFDACYFTSDTRAILKEWTSVRQALNHRPFHPESEAYRAFISQTMLKIREISEKFPYFEVEKEIAQCEALLQTNS
jgi:hypothetical protein